jgi:hypothetical protein
MNNLHSWFYANGLRLSLEETTAGSFHTKEDTDPEKLKTNLTIWISPLNQKQNS